jgi:hypothetical protein
MATNTTPDAWFHESPSTKYRYAKLMPVRALSRNIVRLPLIIYTATPQPLEVAEYAGFVPPPLR